MASLLQSYSKMQRASLSKTNKYLHYFSLSFLSFRAVSEGVCGVPTFRVNDGPLPWGQDRLHVVADMLCGRKEEEVLSSKL